MMIRLSKLIESQVRPVSTGGLGGKAPGRVRPDSVTPKDMNYIDMYYIY